MHWWHVKDEFFYLAISMRPGNALGREKEQEGFLPGLSN
jgi:hypothetical protein